MHGREAQIDRSTGGRRWPLLGHDVLDDMLEQQARCEGLDRESVGVGRVVQE